MVGAPFPLSEALSGRMDPRPASSATSRDPAYRTPGAFGEIKIPRSRFRKILISLLKNQVLEVKPKFRLDSSINMAAGHAAHVGATSGTLWILHE